METGEAGFFFLLGKKNWVEGKKKERKKNENGNVLAGQAGMEVTGWRRIVGLVRKDIRREVLTGWRRK